MQGDPTRLQITGHHQVLGLWLQQRGGLDPALTAAASHYDYVLRLTQAQSWALGDELEAVLDRWLTDHPVAEPSDEGELVSVLLDVVPLREWPA